MKFFEFYDEGWAAKCQDQPYNPRATIDWKDGWRDCNEVTQEEGIRGLNSLNQQNQP